jgi:hypothetical protein
MYNFSIGNFEINFLMVIEKCIEIRMVLISQLSFIEAYNGNLSDNNLSEEFRVSCKA